MLVLAIDTTSEHGGLAIYRDFECLANIRNTGSTGFSVTLFQMLDCALIDAGVKLSQHPLSLRDIDLFAVANGPGSFTGIRTGVAATQGWATAMGRPTKGISIFAAMADEGQPETEWATAIMDARRGEFYLGLFRRDPDGGAFEPDGEGVVLTPEALRTFFDERLSKGAAITCIVRDHDQAARAIRANLPESLRWKTVSGYLVGSIARLALESHRRGKLQSPADLDALYIRRPDAELNWRP
ncbi:MAG TPA: tRNA (adenosine(37)-N6)-threonylcarbamoyltransferase complex dimerization subunit type 1 TsaB [Terriglobia bacterium]|nr:tRNA (adenosine(37)-N6)-threonylcarbamoyltransferase complex dimerization subunit type 1 TsaB [Terriglobia bacterium]